MFVLENHPRAGVDLDDRCITMTEIASAYQVRASPGGALCMI